MQSSDAPNKISIAFARDGDKRPIPNTSQIGVVNGAASYPTGFPPLTFIKKTDGGIPPDGEDFNGVFYDITSIQRWQSAGGLFKFDAALATAIGGYPKGALLMRADGLGTWQSSVENNTSNPDTGGAGWTGNVSEVATYAALRAYAGGAGSINVTGVGIAGMFVRGTGTENGGTVIVAANGVVWVRVYTGGVDIRWWGAKFDSDGAGTGGTDDTAAVQACLNYAVPLQKIIFLPVGLCKITAQLSIDLGRYGLNMSGQGYQRTRFKYPTLETGQSLFLCTGYPGTGGGLVTGVAFDGNSTTNAFSLCGNTSQLIKECQFGDNAFAMKLLNNAPGVFTEFNVLEDCDGLLGCQSAVWYCQEGSGDASFHGSGIKGGTWNNSGIQSVLVLTPAANPYNAPFSPTIFVHANVTIISYGAPLGLYRPNFYGTLKLEVQQGRALLCDAPPERAIAYAGDIVSQSANVQFGSLFICQGLFSVSDGTRQTIGARISRRNNLSGGTNTLPAIPYAIMEGCVFIALHVVGENYDYRLLYSSWGPTTNGVMQLVATYSQFNVAGYGPPVVTLDAQSRIVITNANYPSTGIVSLIDIQQIGQSPSTAFIP
jgi:hypothetical protein